MAPQKMPSIISTPRFPFRDRATGSIMDMPITEDSPGITPTKMPHSTPPRMDSNPTGVSTRARLCVKAANIFCDPLLLKQHALGQDNIHDQREQNIDKAGDPQRGQKDPHRAALPHGQHSGRHKDQRGGDEAEEVQQHCIGDHDHKDDEQTEMFCQQLYDLAMISHQPLPAEKMTEFIQRSNKIMMLLTK